MERIESWEPKLSPEERAELRRIFDTVKDHLIAQGERSQEKNGDCLYQGPNGLICGVGCLVSDVHYSLDLEGESICSPLVQEAIEASGNRLTELTIDMLEELQYMHDLYAPIEWAVRLDEIEEEYFGGTCS